MSPSENVMSAKGNGMGFTSYGRVRSTLTQEVKDFSSRSVSAEEI